MKCRSLYNLGDDTLMKAIEHQMQGLGGVANMGFSGALASLPDMGAKRPSTFPAFILGQGQAKAQDYATRGADRPEHLEGDGTGVGPGRRGDCRRQAGGVGAAGAEGRRVQFRRNSLGNLSGQGG